MAEAKEQAMNYLTVVMGMVSKLLDKTEEWREKQLVHANGQWRHAEVYENLAVKLIELVRPVAIALTEPNARPLPSPQLTIDNRKSSIESPEAT